MKIEIKKLLKDYFDKDVKETRHSYETLKEFFNEEIKKIPFTKLEFKNYKDCYRKLGQIFYDNGVIGNFCRNILNYKNKDDKMIYENRDWKEKGNYSYKNCYNQEECYVKCENRIYKLKYRKLDINKYKK